MLVNPITQIRESIGLTQRGLSLHCNITTQIVQSTEKGLFNKLPISLENFLMPYEPNIQTIYKLHQQQVRRENQNLLAPTMPIPTNFRTYLNQFPSKRHFCKLLQFQPSILDSYLRTGESRELLNALLSEANVKGVVV